MSVDWGKAAINAAAVMGGATQSDTRHITFSQCAFLAQPRRRCLLAVYMGILGPSGS
jgi:hypothetical protein